MANVLKRMGEADVGYDVSVKDLKTDTTTTSQFDYVIVCSG